MQTFDLTDYGDLAVAARAAIGLFPLVNIDPASAVAMYDEIVRLRRVLDQTEGRADREAEQARRWRDAGREQDNRRFQAEAEMEALRAVLAERDAAQAEVKRLRDWASSARMVLSAEGFTRYVRELDEMLASPSSAETEAQP